MIEIVVFVPEYDRRRRARTYTRSDIAMSWILTEAMLMGEMRAKCKKTLLGPTDLGLHRVLEASKLGRVEG